MVTENKNRLRRRSPDRGPRCPGEPEGAYRKVEGIPISQRKHSEVLLKLIHRLHYTPFDDIIHIFVKRGVCACVCVCVCVYQETPFKYLLLTHPLSFQNSCCWVTVSHSLPFRAHLLITPQFLQSPPNPNNLGGHVHLLVPYTY